MILAVVLAAVTLPIHFAVLPGTDSDAPSRPTGPARRPPTDARFWTLNAAFTGASVTSFGASVLLVAYLVDHGWALGPAAVAGGTLGIMQVAGRLLLAPLHDRFDRRGLTRLGLGLPAVGVALLLASGGGPLVWAAVGLLGISQGLNTLLRVTLLVDLYGTRRFGALNGLSATPVVVARALAPLGAAALASLTGGYAVPFMLLVAVSVAASLLGTARS